MLKLLAFDRDDLAVFSAYLENAQVRQSDFVYLSAQQKFVFIANRTCHCEIEKTNIKQCTTGIHFNAVKKVHFLSQDNQHSAASKTLMAIFFEQTQAPSGHIHLCFEDGYIIRLEVEYIEGALKDLEQAMIDTRTLNIQDSTFEQNFKWLLAQKRESASDVEMQVRAIIQDVRERGDDALIELTQKFDQLSLNAQTLRVSQNQIDEAYAQTSPELIKALEFAAKRIESHHQKQKPQDHIYQDALGVTLGAKWSAIESVGLYVPGGTASYPSSVLMNAIPAKVAGVARMVMVVPAREGKIMPAVLAAAKIVGITEIYQVGGAQAIAALAYGTQTIAPVDKIVGPGNAYVATAKKLVFGHVGIDMVAGPSEVLIIADETGNPDWIAADILAQAEHDVSAQSLVITTSAHLVEKIAQSVQNQLKTLPRSAIAAQSWKDFGAIILVENLKQAANLANRIAAEHLEIHTKDPQFLANEITNAGAIFLGANTPEAIGDYVGGSNHVLPTARSARFSSGLGVLDFMKRTSILGCSAESLQHLSEAAITIAMAEGLDAHALSIQIRN